MRHLLRIFIVQPLRIRVYNVRATLLHFATRALNLTTGQAFLRLCEFYTDACGVDETREGEAEQREERNFVFHDRVSDGRRANDDRATFVRVASACGREPVLAEDRRRRHFHRIVQTT